MEDGLGRPGLEAEREEATTSRREMRVAWTRAGAVRIGRDRQVQEM